MAQLVPIDGGPIYAETDLTQFIAEPWNALSSLAIALPSVYWAIKLRWNFKDFGFIYFLIPLLFLGGMGSTLFHAFRTSRFALAMDVVPTAIVTFSVGLFFWARILKKWYFITIVVGLLAGLRFLALDRLSGSLAINVGYFITGVLIFLPLLLYLINHHFHNYRPILISVLCLSISLIFRRIDYSVAEIIPMGSHFLWHIFSGIGAFYLAQYIYMARIEEIELRDA